MIYAGQDLEAGGTWMGRGESGMMAALTNRHSPGFSVPPDVRSRGGIVVTLLQQPGPDEAARWLARQPAEEYRPFNVLFGNTERFYFFTSWDAAPPRRLSPGLYALSNSALDDQSWPKVARAQAFLAKTRALPGERMLLELKAFLGDATPPDEMEGSSHTEEIHGNLGAVFIRSEGYGTVSSTILTEGGSLGSRYYFAEGKKLGENPGQAFCLMDFGNGS